MSLLSLMMTVLLQITGLSAAADALDARLTPPIAQRARVVAPPEPAPRDRSCKNPPKLGTCAGAIGFCPVYRCIEGEWVDVRPSRRTAKGEPLAF